LRQKSQSFKHCKTRLYNKQITKTFTQPFVFRFSEKQDLRIIIPEKQATQRKIQTRKKKLFNQI